MTTNKPYELTPEHRAQLPGWADKWIANALNTDHMDKELVEQSVENLQGLYRAADLTAPEKQRIVFVPSPVVGAILYGVSAGVWWLRTKDEKGNFGHKLSEEEIAAAARGALEKCCNTAYPHNPDIYGLLVEAIAKTADVNINLGADVKTDLEEPTKWLVELCERWWTGYQGGKDWSDYVSYLSFFRHVAKLPIDYSKWHFYEELAQVGPRFLSEHFAILCDRQKQINIDEQNLPHSEHGPAIEWRCGTKAYYWHGTKIPADWVTKKAELKATTILAHNNMEVRRAGCELLGWDKVIESLDAIELDKHENPEIGTLLQADLPEAPRQLFLRVLEGHSGRNFAYAIPSEEGIKTAQQAQNWIWSMPEGEDYAPEFRA